MFSETESIILSRLRARMPGDVHVESIQDAEGAREQRQRAPAIWIIYDGYTPRDAVIGAQVQQVTQDWLIVVQTRSAKGNGTTDAARLSASALCTQVLEALIGFSIGSGKYLRLEKAPGPEYDAGYCYVPLAFSSAATFRGNP